MFFMRAIWARGTVTILNAWRCCLCIMQAESQLTAAGRPPRAGAELQYMDQDFEEWTGLLSQDELSEALSVRPRARARLNACEAAS